MFEVGRRERPAVANLVLDPVEKLAVLVCPLLIAGSGAALVFLHAVVEQGIVLGAHKRGLVGPVLDQGGVLAAVQVV